VETWNFLRRRADWETAMLFWRGLRDTPLRIETVTPSDLERAAAIADTWQERELDIVDCTTFAIMERLGCPRAATFDSDFYIYRYGAQRSKAFEILR
jgi:predicted nucleic acid-binding protein